MEDGSGSTEAPTNFHYVTHTPSLRVHCGDAQSEAACARAIEAHQLAHNVKSVTRVGDTLRLPLRDGKTRELKNSPPDAVPDEQFSFIFIEYSPELRAYVCYLQLWEGSDIALVPDDGSAIVGLDAAPLFSADRSRFATLSADIVYSPNRIRIYRVAKDGPPVLEWSHDAVGWGPGAARWRDSSWLVIETNGLDADMPAPPALAREVSIRRTQDGWKPDSTLP